MAKIIQFPEGRKVKDKPLKPKIKIRPTSRPNIPSNEYADRVERIRKSLDRINRLMKQLKEKDVKNV